MADEVHAPSMSHVALTVQFPVCQAATVDTQQCCQCQQHVRGQPAGPEEPQSSWTSTSGCPADVQTHQHVRYAQLSMQRHIATQHILCDAIPASSAD